MRVVSATITKLRRIQVRYVGVQIEDGMNGGEVPVWASEKSSMAFPILSRWTCAPCYGLLTFITVFLSFRKSYGCRRYIWETEFRVSSCSSQLRPPSGTCSAVPSSKTTFPIPPFFFLSSTNSIKEPDLTPPPISAESSVPIMHRIERREFISQRNGSEALLALCLDLARLPSHCVRGQRASL
jgi:hypothetical protein